MSEHNKDVFYVGYLPLPKAIKRFIVPWLVGNLVLAVGIAAVIASNHREPGDGVWNTSSRYTAPGQLVKEPYPMLVTDKGTYLLVEQGKIGTQERVKDLVAGGFYNVEGYLIERAGRKMIEIDGTLEDPISPIVIDDTPVAPLDKRLKKDLGTHTLRGEIVDPKCYLGVMQPGDGKTHKVCATLCIKGGIPPMLLVKNDKGDTAAYLLTDAEGNAFPESHHEYIADPIEVTGQVHRDGDLLILRADLDSIRRLGVRD
ncbi:MAG: hypothetical protein ACPGYV_02630 [Phycisphaeraceae bacterium]